MQTGSTTPPKPEPPAKVASTKSSAPKGASAYRERQERRRAARRRKLKVMTAKPLTDAQRGYDPLDRGVIGAGLTAVIVAVLVIGAVAVHGLILAAFLGVGMLTMTPKDVKDEAIEVAIIEEPKPPEPEPEPPPPEPEPEPEPEIETPPEPEPEPEPPKPKPKPKRKPPPPPPDPIDKPPEPPKEPPKEEPRRIVGLNMESTVKGGDGPSFATGNTRMGNTGDKAEDPNKVKKIPAGATGGTPGASSGQPNKVASRIPTKGVTYTKPKRRGAVRPAFPEMLRRRGIEGNVTVMVTISKEGLVTAVRVVKGAKYPEFNAAAQKAAKRERFVPATKNGEPISYNLKYTYRFRLND